MSSLKCLRRSRLSGADQIRPVAPNLAPLETESEGPRDWAEFVAARALRPIPPVRCSWSQLLVASFEKLVGYRFHAALGAV